MDLANRPFLAVLDGKDPHDWKPWDSLPLEELRLKFERHKFKLPSAYKDLSGFRLHLLLETQEVLFGWKGGSWVRVVGVVIDGRKPTGQDARQMREAYLSVCRQVRDAKGAWARKYGFFLVVLVSPNWDEEHAEFWDGLKKDAKELLGVEVSLQLVDDEAPFVYALRTVNMQLIDAVKRWRAIGGD